MKIFVSMKVPRGDAELEQLAALAQDTISQVRHDPFIATREIAALGLTAPKDFMPFVRQQVATSGLMIVLYHPELRGGLIELGIAYAQGIPVWLCCPSGQYVSNSALGCADLTIEYTSLEDLRKKLFDNLKSNGTRMTQM
jgi:hypothetical protein